MTLNKIYKTIEEDSIQISIEEFKGFNNLPENLSEFSVAYTGKHNAFLHNFPEDLTEEDFDIHLLVECRLFNENEEIFIFPRQGEIYQRTIKSGNEQHQYISKQIQLRNEEGMSESKNDTLFLRHYLDSDGGYELVRYFKIKNQ